MSKKEVIPTYELYDKLERTIPFDIQELQEKNSYDFSKHHRHSYYEVFLFSKGSGTHTIDFKTYSINPFSVHFVSPGQVHLVKRSLDSNGYVFLFSRDFFHVGLSNNDILFELPFFNNPEGKPVLQLDKETFAQLKASIKEIEIEYKSSNSDKESIIRAYLDVLFIKLKRVFDKQNTTEENSNNPQNVLIKKFKILIEKYFLTHHKPNQYADLLNITTGYLNEITKEIIGKSSTDLINERIILEAKRILFHSNKTISEIATTLNYSDPAYFTRFFKTQVGVSPLEYREQEKKKHL